MHDEAGLDAVAELAHVRERVLDLIVELRDRAHTQRHDDQIGGQHALLTGGDGGNGHTGTVYAQDPVAEDGLNAGVLGVEQVEAVVGVGRDLVGHHVHDGDGVVLREHARGLQTGLTGAEHDDLLAGDGGLAADILAHAQHVFAAESVDRRDELVRAGRDEHSVGIHGAQHLRGALGVELHTDAEFADHALVVVDEPAELVFADRSVGEVHCAADAVGLFKHGHVKAALGERHGGFQSGRACADDGHGQMIAVDVELCGHAVFAAASGVHGAAGLLRAEGRLGQAVHARHAVFELILAPLRDLVAELRLGEQLAAEGHGVALTVADDAVDVVGMAQRAAGRDRDADAVFHDLGIGDLPALFPVAVGAHAGQARHHAAAVDGDEAHAVLLEQRRRAAEPGHAGLAAVAVRAVHLRHDLHVGAGLPDAVDDLEREAHGVVHVLRAVFVRAVVEVRAVELLGQVVVRHVPLDGVGAGLGTADGRVDIFLLHLLDHLAGHIVDCDQLRAVGLDVVRLRVGQVAGHPELAGELRALVVHSVDRRLEAGDILVVVEEGLLMLAVPLGLDAHDARGDERGAAVGDGAVVFNVFLTDEAVGAEILGHCREDHAVAQLHVADFQRLEKFSHDRLYSFLDLSVAARLSARGSSDRSCICARRRPRRAWRTSG